MIRCEVIKDFSLKRFDELVDIKRKSIDTYGKLYVEDTFKCDKEMVKYLTGRNKLGKTVVKVIEIEVEPKMPTIIGHRADDVEYVTPLVDKEKLDKIGKDILKYVKPKKKSK